MICHHCIGRKTLLALGAMIKDCPTCNGTGFIDEEPGGVKPTGARKKRRNKQEMNEARNEFSLTDTE